ncbi:hypothetical protein chiPu_0007866 [Chiloscyllium punctatum]|uniref:Uncharacterized protein n=1 Tax=Chiloscyllium punctatum TaxID=137246 RepID=A0A401SGC4_CHIPU|nr:hypothetical protein [Chiloscyllium punctatum]
MLLADSTEGTGIEVYRWKLDEVNKAIESICLCRRLSSGTAGLATQPSPEEDIHLSGATGIITPWKQELFSRQWHLRNRSGKVNVLLLRDCGSYRAGDADRRRDCRLPDHLSLPQKQDEEAEDAEGSGGVRARSLQPRGAEWFLAQGSGCDGEPSLPGGGSLSVPHTHSGLLKPPGPRRIRIGPSLYRHCEEPRVPICAFVMNYRLTADYNRPL